MRYIIISLQVALFAIVSIKWHCDMPQPDARAAFDDPPIPDRRESNGKEILGPGLGQYIFIADGEFTMGCESGEQDDERPEHNVELSSFFVGTTAVTHDQFVEFLNEAQIKPEEYLLSKVDWRKDIILADGKWVCSQGAEDSAASTESWILSERYCEWLSKKTGRAHSRFARRKSLLFT